MKSAHKAQISEAVFGAFTKLKPSEQIKNPVMFLVFVGAILCSALAMRHLATGEPWGFEAHVSVWLWFTVLFANFAEALAEGRGKAQARSLRKTRGQTVAKCLKQGREVNIASQDLEVGDLVICVPGDVIPGDGEIVEGSATIDESAITGESAPVIRESGGDRTAVTGGTTVLSDRIVIRISSRQGDSFLDRMIALVEGAKRQKTPNEVALGLLLVFLSAVFLVVCFTLKPLASYAGVSLSVAVLVALLVCLIPTTIGGLLSAIGISGMDRLLKRNILAMSGRAVEASGDIDVLLLDKTGTITLGNRQAHALYPVSGVAMKDLAEAAYLSSLADETPEGRSIVVLVSKEHHFAAPETGSGTYVPFSAKTRMSGADIGARRLRKGAFDAMAKFAQENGLAVAPELKTQVEAVARRGSTPLVVGTAEKLLGVVELKDIVKPGIRERFSRLRRMGIRSVMITGDNPLTAAAIAAEAGVDDFIAEATPESKLARIRQEQAEGRLVAMVGDGTNDAPALAQADVGLAMNTGTQAAREAANMIDLDSDPTKLIEAVEIGKQLLMTRGSLTTFSLANDVAKYFAIVPAIFGAAYGAQGLFESVNLMKLATPESAILSSVIFNALVIPCLIPLALKGVKYRPEGASTVLARNLLVYGLGGIIAPFIGIKLIDLVLVGVGLA
jgi:K+-transporting ATPase ATPase B chain